MNEPKLLNTGCIMTIKISQLLSKDELKLFTERSDLQGFWALFVNWGLVAVAFALPAIWTNPITIIISLVILANRQLGLGILMHDCAHGVMFKTKWLNEFVGTWFCAAPIYAHLDGYRQYHLKHHRVAGTKDDPDYGNYKDYPVSKASFIRKVIRDFTGLSGIKVFYALMLMNLGFLSYDFSYQTKDTRTLRGWAQFKYAFANHIRYLGVHLAMALILWSLGVLWVYVLWHVSVIFVGPFVFRIRNAAEHGAVPDLLNTDPMMNTRTTKANWIERLIFAPNHVNYHLEHHLLASVPAHRLKAFHETLAEKGVMDRADIANGYVDVIKKLMTKTARPEAVNS